MSTSVIRLGEEIAWESPDGQRRQMGMVFERDITPTVNMAAGTVLIPPGCEQTKLSRHEGKEEIYYVVAGTGVFVLEDEHHEVEAGCTVYIGPGVGHRAVNTGADDLRLFWVNSPPVFETPEEYRDYTKDWKQVR